MPRTQARFYAYAMATNILGMKRHKQQTTALKTLVRVFPLEKTKTVDSMIHILKPILRDPYFTCPLT